MYPPENAAISYQPDDEQAGSGAIQVALVEAERQLMHRKGFKGIGVGQTPKGQDAIVVYVEDQQTLTQLPSTVSGFPVVGVVTGDVRAL